MSAPVLLCTDTFWAEHGARIEALVPDLEPVFLVADEQVSAADIERITIAFYSPDAWPQRSRAFFGVALRAPNLGWLQTFSAGTDRPAFALLRDRGVAVTSAAGAAGPSIAQTVLLYLLALGRHLPAVGRDQVAHVWNPRTPRDLTGMNLGVVGFGGIGSEVARLADAFGMHVTTVRRAVRGDEPFPTWPPERLDDLLGWADAIVVTAPLADDTRGMFDAGRFAAMRPGAWFVNVGRGEVVVEDDLIAALESGHLGGAGLDVFAVEPLPIDSRLWDHPNVIITPHSSGATERSRLRSIDTFVANLSRYLAGESLVNEMSPPAVNG